jgi:hypothetical protein
VTGLLLLVSCVAAGCTDADAPSERVWTEHQAESITSVRGTPVRVRDCRGRGKKQDDRYSSFDCLAGARNTLDRYDTVGVFYVLHPLGKYEGPTSAHRLTNVRFVGGPGIP